MIMVDEQQTRHLHLAGTYNVRDTGGYGAASGGATRWRTLLRGDSLHRLSAAGQETLIAAGLRTVIDLRRDSELAHAPNVFATSEAVRYRNVSLLATITESLGPVTLDDIYLHILDGAHDQLREVFAILAEPGAFPALVHCTAGKDRTGLIVALLLGNAGVPAATIAADYALSEGLLAGEFVTEMRERVVAAGGDWALMAPLMGSPEELMLHTLVGIDARHGSIPDYLRAIGVPETQLDVLRAALVGEVSEDAVEKQQGGETMTITFVHLTDTHIQPGEGDRFVGLDTMQSLRDTLAMLRERGVLPEAPIVISGDLANNGEPESYARLRAVLDELREEGVTVLLALGNHDNRAVFRTAILNEPTGDGTQKYYYSEMLGALRLIVLDSNEIGTHDGQLGEVQLAWLRDELATPAPGGTIIVVHHPPTEAPMPILAGHLLQDADALREIVAGSDVLGVLAGHTHVAAVALFAGVPSVSAPGTAFLLDVTSREGMRFLDGGGINIVTVQNKAMTTKPVALPRSQSERYHYHPGDPIERLSEATSGAEPVAADA